VDPKKTGDPPFEVSDEEAARLVDLKIAKIVEVEAKNIITGGRRSTVTYTPANDDKDGTDTEHPAYDESMKLDQLRKIARIYGLDDEALVGLKSKKAVVAAIDAKRADGPGDDDEGSEDDDELPPDLTPSDLV